MASNKKSTKSTEGKKAKKTQEAHITNFLSSVIDSTKDLVDDLLETAGDVEKDVRERADDVRETVTPSNIDIESLRKQVRNLSDQVEKLANLRVSTK